MMPQIEEAQFVYWGSMRPDIIPLAAPGITMAVGPNGSGKSCWLDGLKIILGVSDLSGNRTPGSYIFNGKPSGVPADQAWLRATFANPYHPGQHHRVFNVAGPGLDVEHVTVVCRVRGDKRQYLFLPGRVTWGADIRAELDELMERYPESRWKGPDQYDTILTRAGVTKSLRGVLALPQGATDRLVAERPSGLMKRLLDLTGRQETLEKFRLAKAEHDRAVIAHSDAKRRFDQKKLDVERLDMQLRQHRAWVRDTTRRTLIDEVLLPAARHFEADNALDGVKTEIGQKQADRARLDEEAKALRRQQRAAEDGLAQLAEWLPDAAQRREALEQDLSEADTLYGRALERFRLAWDAVRSARAATGRLTLQQIEAGVTDAEAELAVALRAREDANERQQRSREDGERIRHGGTLAPAAVRNFVDQLRATGVKAQIVGDLLETAAVDDAHAGHMRTALGDATWAVLVPDSQYQAACQHAIDAVYTWPIVRQGAGTARHALKAAAPSELQGLLEHLDAVVATGVDEAAQLNATGVAAVTANGIRHGVVVSRLTPVHDPVLQSDARARAMALLDDAAEQAEQQSAEFDAVVPPLRSRLNYAYVLADTARRLEAIRQDFRAVCSDLARIKLGRALISKHFTSAKARERELLGIVEGAKSDVETLEKNAADKEADAEKVGGELEALNTKRVACEIALADHPLPPQYVESGTARLRPEELHAERNRLALDLDDTTRYPLDVRDPIIVSQYEAEQDRLASVEDLIADKSGEMEQRAKLVQSARASYDAHIGAVVRELKSRFVDICQIAGIVGDIRLVPGDVPDEPGVDVLVSHKAGEEPVSYQDDSHSGGQGTKISILLLLAAMSLGRTADLLIVDEHRAHLDGTNNSQIIEIMRNLGTKVQFVLSAPTSAKEADEEADWCDIQVGFLPREPGEAFSPPVRLMSRLGAQHLEERFRSLQQRLI
jgi:chromosome segregation ATPase